MSAATTPAPASATLAADRAASDCHATRDDTTSDGITSADSAGDIANQPGATALKNTPSPLNTGMIALKTDPSPLETALAPLPNSALHTPNSQPLSPTPGPAAQILDPHANTPTARLIAQITRRKIDPASLAPALRQECVHYLSHNGFTNDEIAKVLRVSDRTVTRDRQAARREHALVPAAAGPGSDGPRPRLSDELMGEFQSIALASIQRLTRLCHDTTVPAPTRLSAEEAINRIYHRFLSTAERLHYFQEGDARNPRSSRATLEEESVSLPAMTPHLISPIQQKLAALLRAMGL